MKKAKSKPSISDLEEAKKENPCPFPSLHLLKEYGELKRFRKEKPNEQSSNASSSTGVSQLLSTHDIMKLARARLLQCTSQNSDVVLIMISDSFHDRSGMPPETYADFELAMLLHASSLKIFNQQFDRARKLLSLCEQSASVNGNPVQRLVFYFTEALQERISREMKMVRSDAPEGNQRKRKALEEALTIFQPPVVQFQQEIPFCPVTHFTAIQAILENVASAKRVHLIDLGIKSGSHWTIMMQALADRHECPLELLKLTAVGTSKEIIEEIGKMLSSFAETLKIPFQFNIVVSEMENLKEDLFEVAAGEELVVYSEFRLAHLLVSPDDLESLLGAIKKLHPCLMVIIELEANTNASCFVDRFNEAVSICAAVFDCLDVCLERDNEFRATIEGVFIRDGIQNLVIEEGKERVYRQQRMDLWRALFTRFELVEIPLSKTALYQANLIVNSNPLWSSCTLGTDGKSLILGWKETPIQVLSVWKFQT